MRRQWGMRGGAALVAVVAAAATLAGCGSSGSSSSGSDNAGGSGPYNLLVIGAVTGAQAAPTASVVQGLQLATDAVNASGGINGRQIVLTIKDDQGDPTKAVSALQGAVSSGPKPDAVFAGVTSPEALALLPVLTRDKILSITSASSAEVNDGSKYPYNFQLPISSTNQIGALGPHLKSTNVTKLGLLVSDDAFGQGVQNSVTGSLKNSGIDIVTQKFSATSLDLTVPYQTLASSNPQAIYTDCTGDPCARILAARYRAGGNLPMIAGTGLSSTGGGPYAIAPPEQNVGLLISLFKFQQYQDPSARSPEVTKFYNAYVAKFGAPKASLFTTGVAWDGVNLLAAAAKKSGKPEDVAAMATAFTQLGDYQPGTWLTQTTFTYTTAAHTPQPAPDSFIYVPSGPLVDGFYKSAS